MQMANTMTAMRVSTIVTPDRRPGGGFLPTAVKSHMDDAKAHLPFCFSLGVSILYATIGV